MSPPTELPSVVLEERIVDLTADQFLGMPDDLFPRDRRFYLWGGRVVEKAGKDVAFCLTSVLLHGAVRSRIPDGWLASSNNPLRLDDRHVPLPELAVIRGPIEVYERENRRPTAADVGLVIELVYSSLPGILNPRAEAFARSGVPAYWVVDVVARRIIEYREPTTVDGVGLYAHGRTRSKGDETPLILDGLRVAVIPVAELLPESGRGK